MRKTIILGSILALIGAASVAQARDQSNPGERDANRVQGETSDGSRAGRTDRVAREEHSRDRHDHFAWRNCSPGCARSFVGPPATPHQWFPPVTSRSTNGR